MKCPNCGAEISHLEFCGDAYYGSYEFNARKKFNFTCPECGKAVVQKEFTITENDLTDKLDGMI